MKKTITLTITFLYTTFLIGQADLVLSAAGFQPNPIDKGDIFLVQAQVTNIGNAVAPANYMFIYYSQDLTLSDDEIISRVAVKELAPNESQDVNFIYPIPPTLTAGNYYVGYSLDPFNTVLETDENNLFCASDGPNCVTFRVSNLTLTSQKFNYPILFIHGLASNDETWDDFTDEAESYYGWSYGGRFNYCLNPDGIQATSDGIIQPFYTLSNLTIGDYYQVNFDVSRNGILHVGNDGIPFNDDYSNQSAIVKQGWAVGDAIEKVLDLTGAEKVILVGHSMGGLASREYLQNPGNWQADNQHHVAKLLTIGTPNGGSNLAGGLLSSLLGIDESSEAVRDLRYFSLFFEGIYLDGGTENNLSTYYNDDINCNGFVGDDIIGLNSKTAPSDINYACIVGVGNNLPGLSGDGVVAESRADLNNYLLAQPPLGLLHADRFDVTTGHTDMHQENHSTLIQGLDEPPFYDLAYPIPLNSFNYAYSTVQAANSPVSPPNNEADWDIFKIEVEENGLLQVDIWNIPVHGFALYLRDSNNGILEEVQSTGNSNIGFDYPITPGTYYIECGSLPSPNSWRFPYAYSVLFEVAPVANFTSNIKEGCEPLTVNFTNQSDGDPSTYSWTFAGGMPNTSNEANPTVTYNQAGVYPVSLTVSNSAGNNTITQSGYITVKSSPVSDFAFSQQGLTVVFENQTQTSLETPDYLWDFGDNQSSMEVSPIHTYQSDGNYTVQLSSTNSCGSSDLSKVVDIVTVSTDDLLQQSAISIHPNPVSEILTLSIEGKHNGEYQIAIINNIGQVIKQNNVYKNGLTAEFQINISDLPSGSYLLQINSGEASQVRKIIKK